MALANSSRARILDRIRKAHVVPEHSDDAVTIAAEQIFLPIGDALQRFLSECKGNLIEVRTTHDAAESATALQDLLQSAQAGRIYVQDHPRLRAFAAAFADREVFWSSTGRAPENCAASVTLCEGLVAQTGSILSSSRNGGRGASIIPPTHLVYATSDQLVREIAGALHGALTSDLADASYFGLISGSSRTADIEKILVQGAHGPIKVAIVLQVR